MKIYRLEHRDTGRGPHAAVYHDSDTAAAWELVGEDAGASSPNRPSPVDDFGMSWQKELTQRFNCTPGEIIFGCESYEALQAWFSGELFELLLHAGHEVKIYNVPEERTFRGEKQVAFVKP